MTVIETVGVIIAIALYPFMERHIWNVMQDTIDECDVTSVAYYAIEYVQMVVSRKFAFIYGGDKSFRVSLNLLRHRLYL